MLMEAWVITEDGDADGVGYEAEGVIGATLQKK